MKLFEWQSGDLKQHADKLPVFISYLNSVWENRNIFTNEITDDSEENDFLQPGVKQRFFDFRLDEEISARNYIGVVQFEGIRIEVYPKIFKNSGIADANTWQRNILFWLTHCRKFRFPFSIADVSKTEFDNFLELIIYLFAHQTQKILESQPFQAYQSVEEETTFLKGRLAFEKYTNNHLITGKWQSFHCQHSPFVVDNLFNRIVKYVSKRLSLVSYNSITKGKLQELLHLMDEVTDLPCISSDCDKVHLGPLYADHKSILDLCRLFLSNEMINMNCEQNDNFCFLFPMEYVFEDFIFGFISKHWPETDVLSQSTSYLAMTGNSQVFKIRNDIILENKVVVDTKYKLRVGPSDLQGGVKQTDIYQMISYGLKRHSTELVLLYPYCDGCINETMTFTVQSDLILKDFIITVMNIDVKVDNLDLADEIIKARIQQLRIPCLI